MRGESGQWPLSESGFAGFVRIFRIAGDRLLSVGRVFLAADEGMDCMATRVRDAASQVGTVHIGGWDCLRAIREVQNGHKGCAYGVDLEEGEGDVCGSTRAGTRAAPTGGGRRMGRSTVAAGGQGHIALTLDAAGVVGEGALRGRSPRTREGRIGPTAQKCRG